MEAGRPVTGAPGKNESVLSRPPQCCSANTPSSCPPWTRRLQPTGSFPGVYGAGFVTSFRSCLAVTPPPLPHPHPCPLACVSALPVWPLVVVGIPVCTLTVCCLHPSVSTYWQCLECTHFINICGATERALPENGVCVTRLCHSEPGT